MLKIKKFTVNPLQENTYLLFDQTKEAIIVDAGFYYREEEEEVARFIQQNDLKLKKLINTHCHFDHLMGVESLRQKYNINFEAHLDEAPLIGMAVAQASLFGFEMQPVAPADDFLVGNEYVEFGETKLKIIHVPGHSPGHIVLFAEKEKKLFAGDVLFYGSIGRTDLPGGDYNTLISRIKSELFVLPGDTSVFCGHGPETTIGYEKAHNPFLS